MILSALSKKRQPFRQLTTTILKVSFYNKLLFPKLIQIFLDQDVASDESSSDVNFVEDKVGRPQTAKSCIDGISEKLVTLRTLAPKLTLEELRKMNRSLDQCIDDAIKKRGKNVKEERDSGNTSDEDVKPTVSFKKAKVERSTR